MRYTAEIRLRFVGDSAECQKLIPRARTILGEVWNRDIVLGGLDQSWRFVRLSDTAAVRVYASRLINPIVTIYAGVQFLEENVPARFLLFAAWYPEGIVMTPVSTLAPLGKGLPLRDPLTGDLLVDYATANPVFPQVLINRFENNKYLDRQGFVAGTQRAGETLPSNPPQLRATYATAPEEAQTEFRYWYKIPRPIAYTSTQGVYEGPAFWADTDNQAQYPTISGEYLVTEQVIDGKLVARAQLLTEQKTPLDGIDTIFEPESSQWYAHRPEEILYPAPAHEAIFLRTNEYRAELFGPPVHRQLRGEGNASAIAVAECALAGDLSHDSLNFRPGFRTAYGKTQNATSEDFDSGENLLVSTDTDGLTTEIGNAVALYWRNSLGHWSNMISTRWDNDANPPGAQHQIAYTSGTITEQSQSIPDIPDIGVDPITGGIWSQTFSKREEWVRSWEHWYEGDFGLVGWEGTGKPQGNEFIDFPNSEYEARFGFRGCVFSLPNSVLDHGTVRILGVAVYDNAGELWFRVATLTNTVSDETLPPPQQILGDGEIRIYRAPVGLTENEYRDTWGYYEPDIQRSWDLEGVFPLPFAIGGGGTGWLYPAFASAAVSPNGRRFCFTYQKYRIDNQDLLHRSSNDFGYTPVISRDFLVTWFSHIEKEVDLGFVENERLPPTVTVSATNVQPGPNYINRYERAVQTTYDFMPYYTDQNVLEYVQLDINESQVQQSSGRFWRVHKLIFSSGKEVVLQYQALDNIVTPASFPIFQGQHPSFPLEPGIDDAFSTVIHYLDPKNEDVVYTRYYARYEDDNPQSITGDFSYFDKQQLVVSFGSDPESVVWERDDNWTTRLLGLSGAQILTNSTTWGGTGPWSTGPTQRLIRTPNSYSVYNYKAPVAFINGINIPGPPPLGTNGLWDGSVVMQRVTWPYFLPFNNASAVNQYDPTAYGLYDTYAMYNKENYSACVWQPPPVTGNALKENRYQERITFNNLINASLYVDNLAPLFHNLDTIDFSFVRYRDRWLLRGKLETIAGQLYAEPAVFSQLPTFPGWDQFALPNPPIAAEAQGLFTKVTENGGESVLIAANFDIDDAAGIVDVTDVDPIGRAV